jgi:hypothetical protein
LRRPSPLTIDIADDGDVLGPTSLRYAFLVAVDMLAYGAAIRNRAHAQEKLRRIKQQFTTYRDTDDSQPVSTEPLLIFEFLIIFFRHSAEIVVASRSSSAF